MSYSWETWDAWQPADEPVSENPSAASSGVGASSAAAATVPASVAASDSTGGVAASSGDSEPRNSVPDQLAG